MEDSFFLYSPCKNDIGPNILYSGLALAHSWRGVAESFNFNKWCLKIKSPRHCTEHFSRIFWELSWFYQHLESLLCKISVILSTFIYYIYFIKQFVPTIKSIFRIYLAVVALLSRTWTWTRAVSHCTMLIPAPFPFLLMLGMATKKNNKYQNSASWELSTEWYGLFEYI